MQTIVFDLEFNQDFPSLMYKKRSDYPFEIIQIGAILLDDHLNTVATFNRNVKPTIYAKINPLITELTGITTEHLMTEEPFPAVFNAFCEFIGNSDSIFCIWGMSDIKELFRNAKYHQLNHNHVPRNYINLQPYVSIHLRLPEQKLLNLQVAVEALHIPITTGFHQAIYDAYYTAEIYKKIDSPFIQSKFYDPTFVKIQVRQRKREINVNKLMEQFRKMLAREMTDEEQSMILLAYKMGKTNQFLE